LVVLPGVQGSFACVEFQIEPIGERGKMNGTLCPRRVFRDISGLFRLNRQLCPSLSDPS
jgi:hypothetical protein